MANQGKITEIIGPVIDVSFEENNLPKILNALEMALFETKSNKIQLLFKDSGDTVEKAIAADIKITFMSKYKNNFD